MSEDEFVDDEENLSRQRECGEECPHYDNVNQCCWQATEKGLCFDVEEGDRCHLGYKDREHDWR